MSVRTTVVAALAAVAVAAGVIIPVPDDRVVAAIPEDVGVHTTLVDGSDLQSWSYTGPWEHATGHWWTQGQHDDSESFSRAAGARATLQFWGTGVTIAGPTGSNGGLFRVTLDCTTVVEGSSYSASKVLNQSLASFDGLVPGLHTVVVEALGTRAPGSSDSFVMIDVATVVDDTFSAYSPPHEPNAGPIALRRPGCGVASDLVGAHRVRTGEDRFTLTVDGSATTPIALPDVPRTLHLAVEAGSSPVHVAVADANGDFYPVIALTGPAGAMSATSTSEAIQVPAASTAEILVDLRSPSGAGSSGEVRLFTMGQGSTLEIIAGRTSDVAAPRLARQLNSGVPLLPELPGRIAAPTDAFRHGPVVLSRVLADADQPAWSTQSGAAVPLSFGGVHPGEPARVGTVALPADTIGVEIPASGESVRIRLDTSRRCRTLTASLAVDARSPAGSFADFAVYGDGFLLQAHHNGLWQNPATGYSPVINGSMRETLAAQLRDAKYGIGATAYGSDASSLAAYRSLVLTEFEAMNGTVRDRDASTMRYPVASPVRFGAGATVNRGAPVRFTPPHAEAGAERTPLGWVAKSVPVTPVDSQALFPLAVDLIAPHSLDRVRYASSHNLAGANQLGHVLVATVEIVVSGTPGAVLDLVSAGLDCVTVDPAPDGTAAPRYAMPTFSQIGVPPLFLPARRDESGRALTELGANPLWWDLVCPHGPSTTGPTFTATRERFSSFGVLGWNGRDYHQIEVHEVATASKPACGLPADQARDDFGEYSLASGSPHRPSGDALTLSSTVRDPIADRLIGIDGTWKQKFGVWAANTLFEASHDQLGLALWLALAPIDLPAAIVFNPLVIHGAPVEAQLVLGAAFLSAGAFSSGVAQAIPAASGLAAGARASLESTGEVLLLTEQQVQAAKAAGVVGVIRVGDELQLVVPLKAGSGAADVAPRLTSTHAVTTDAAVSRLPVTNDRAPWVVDAPALREAESVRLCTRDAEMFCPVRIPEQFHSARWTGIQPDGTRYPRGFWERYPTVTTTTALSNTPEAAQAVAATRLMNGSGIDPLLAHLNLGNGVTYPVAFATDTRPLYRFGSRGPDLIFSQGFQVRQAAIDAFVKGNHEYLDLLRHASPNAYPLDDALYVSTTRDPDLLGARYEGNDQLASHWRYKISRPVGGGGVEVRASFGQADQAGSAALPAAVRELASHDLILAESEVSIPGGVSPAFIERADYMQYNPATRRFEVAHSVPNPGFRADLVYGTAAIPSMTELERTGSSVTGSAFHGWVKFDWMPVARGLFTLDVPAPTAAFVAAAEPGATLVFTKSEKVWRAYPSGAGLSPTVLRNAGFTPGTYAGHPDVVFWIPRPGAIPVTSVSSAGFAALPVKRSVSDDPAPTYVSVSRHGQFLGDTGRDYAVAGSGSGVHDLAMAPTADGGRWQLEELSDFTFRLINPSLGTALQITNEWHGDPTLGRHVVVGSPTGWNNAYQRWTLESGDEGAIVFRSVTSPGLTLQVAEDGAVVAGPSEDASVRQWIMQAAP